MPLQRSRRLLTSVHHLLAASLALSAGGLAQADPNPYYIGSSLTVAHDSNVFRLPSAVSDTSYSLGLLGGFDQPIGRQRLYASGTVRDTRFQDLKQLDHTNYSVLAGLDWETIHKLSGTLSFSGNQSLFNYGGTSTVLSSAKNIERRNESIARVRYGGASLLVLETSFTHRTQKYSDPAYQFNGLTQDAVSIGVSYRPSAALTLGPALRFTKGKYQTEREFKRRDIDLTANWVPTGLSSISGRVSFGRSKASSGTSEFDFSGTTGQLSWNYQPTGKLRFISSVSRDSGAESGFINVDGLQTGGIGDNSRVTTVYNLNSIYTLSSKIRVDGAVRLTRRSLSDGPLDGSDSLRVASLGATYSVLRNTTLACTVRRELRNASGAGSFDYGASVVWCSAQITLQ